MGAPPALPSVSTACAANAIGAAATPPIFAPSSIGWRNGRNQLHCPEPAACHHEPATLQHQSRICPTRSSTGIRFISMSRLSRTSALRPGRWPSFDRSRSKRKSLCCATPSWWNTTRVYALKVRFLRLLFQASLNNEWRHGTARATELKQYIEREGQLLHRFAVHSALDQAIHKECPDVWNWKSWPEPYQDPESAETRQFARKHWRSILFHKYLQWQLDVQLASGAAACPRARARHRTLS